MINFYKKVSIVFFFLYFCNTKVKTASIVSDESCELLCTIGGTMLFTVIKSCYPTAFYIESMSTTNKIIYSICSNDVINWSSKMVLMALNASCDVWVEKRIENTGAESICTTRHQHRKRRQLENIF